MSPNLELKYGRRDLFDAVEEARQRIEAGELEAIVIIELANEDERSIKNRVAWKDDMAFHWSRIIAAAAALLHDLNAEGLEDQS